MPNIDQYFGDKDSLKSLLGEEAFNYQNLSLDQAEVLGRAEKENQEDNLCNKSKLMVTPIGLDILKNYGFGILYIQDTKGGARKVFSGIY